MKFALFTILALVIGLGVARYLGLSKVGTTVSSEASEAPLSSDKPTSFEELSIPYLRKRSYSSQISDLTPYLKNSSFETFLTSYTSDGLKINALITKPSGAGTGKTYPAIVFVHGYIPPTQYKTTEKYVDYVNYLAKSGFVVFKIDLRGHGESEGEAEGAYYSEKYVIDTLNAVEALKKLSFVNKDKIGLWGHSMAGNVVSRALAVRPEIPALAIWAGAGYTYQDLQDYRLNDQSYRPPAQSDSRARRRQELFGAHGQYYSGSGFWKTVAITDYLADIKGAVSLHHAVDDNVVSVEYSRNLIKLLNSNNVPSEYFEYKSGGHNITGTNFSKAMQNTVNFYNKYLGN